MTESIAIASVKLTPAALDKMLDELDGGSIIPSVENRKTDRVCCHWTGIIVVVNQRGYQSTFLIPVRDISKSGVAFLHRSMFHKGTPCSMRIRTPDQKWLQVRGKVVRSRYIRDMVYEVGLKFNEPIGAEHFALLSEKPSSRAKSQTTPPQTPEVNIGTVGQAKRKRPRFAHT